MTLVDFIPAIFFAVLGLLIGFGVLYAAGRLVRRLAPKKRERD